MLTNRLNFLKNLAIITAITSSLYSANSTEQQNNNQFVTNNPRILEHLNNGANLEIRNCVPQDYSNEENIDSNIVLKALRNINNYLMHIEQGNKWAILYINVPLFQMFSSQQLINAINEIFTKAYNEMKTTNNPSNKIKFADPFFRLMYQTQKLSAILKKINNENILKTIDSLINELDPLLEDHAITNVSTDELLGLDKFSASLLSINENFISGFEFNIDFTKFSTYNEDKFKEYYMKFLKTPAVGICLNTSFIHNLIKILNELNIDGNNVQLCNTINNLKNFFNETIKCVEKKIDKVINNIPNLYQQAWEKQQKNVNFDALVNYFIESIENSGDLKRDDKIDLFRTFFNHLFVDEYFLDKVLHINNIETIDKLNSLLNREDVKDYNLAIGVRLNFDDVWKQVCKCYNEGKLKQGMKLECYYDNILPQANKIINDIAKSRIDQIKQDNNNINTNLKNTLFEYFNTLIDLISEEKQKCESFFYNKQALVPVDFWKQK